MQSSAWIAKPVKRKLQNHKQESFGALNAEAAVTKGLQISLISRPRLAIPYAEGLKLDTDVCCVQIACGFLQEEPNKTKKIVVNRSWSITKPGNS